MLEMLVSRRFATAAVEWHEPPHRHQRGDRRGEGKHERIPVTRECFARVAQEADRTDVGSEHRQSHRPPRQGPSASDKTLGIRFAQREQSTQANRDREVPDQDDQVDDGQPLRQGEESTPK